VYYLSSPPADEAGSGNGTAAGSRNGHFMGECDTCEVPLPASSLGMSVALRMSQAGALARPGAKTDFINRCI
jgi:hypothetical protein